MPLCARLQWATGSARIGAGSSGDWLGKSGYGRLGPPGQATKTDGLSYEESLEESLPGTMENATEKRLFGSADFRNLYRPANRCTKVVALHQDARQDRRTVRMIGVQVAILDHQADDAAAVRP
jgi:hypothetical protein